MSPMMDLDRKSPGVPVPKGSDDSLQDLWCVQEKDRFEVTARRKKSGGIVGGDVCGREYGRMNRRS